MNTAIAIAIAVVGFVAVLACSRAAYRNGVTDGYGYAVEPTCPGYGAAGEYLRTAMSHRWHELREDAADVAAGRRIEPLRRPGRDPSSFPSFFLPRADGPSRDGDKPQPPAIRPGPYDVLYREEKGTT